MNNKRKIRGLTVKLPTGERYLTGLVVLLNPILLALVAIAVIAIMLYFNVVNSLVITALFIMLTLSIFIRWRERNKPLISTRKSRKFNDFIYSAQYLERRYFTLIDFETVRTQEDIDISLILYQQLIADNVELGLYTDTNITNVNALTGYEFTEVEPITCHVDVLLNKGEGYVLIEPPQRLISQTARTLSERNISCTLRKIGLTNWTVENVTYDGDSIFLFRMHDESQSRAYDFSGAE